MAALSHALDFAVAAPAIARCARCGQILTHLAEVAAPCPGAPADAGP